MSISCVGERGHLLWMLSSSHLISQMPSGRLQVTRFKGQLSGSATAALPSSLEHLYLAVRDEDHARALLPALSSLPTRLPRLRGLGLHVGAGLDAASLRPLPDVEYTLLWVSGVEEATVEGASRVVAALQPPEGYFMLHFPGALRDDSASFYRLVKHLCQEGVRVMGGVSASPKIDKENEERLEDLVRRELGCGFGMSNEEDIWSFLL
ncbi:uncharacterized protein [Penaeus vannamei]|uniref:uncharacterized protein n=1 Tax=Penaeus vannamei TaxID=6689 RepID=UPI00387F698F